VGQRDDEDAEFYTRDASADHSARPDWADVAISTMTMRKLRAYMIDMLKFWVREYDLDGFRCDVAGMVPTDSGSGRA
jgi:alpha-amylase